MNLPPTFFHILNPDHERYPHLEQLRDIDKLRYLQLAAIALECDAGGRLIDVYGDPLSRRRLADRLATRQWTLAYTLRALIAAGLLTHQDGVYALTEHTPVPIPAAPKTPVKPPNLPENRAPIPKYQRSHLIPPL